MRLMLIEQPALIHAVQALVFRDVAIVEPAADAHAAADVVRLFRRGLYLRLKCVFHINTFSSSAAVS